MLTVLGGLVPTILARDLQPPAPPHLGTTDLDILLRVHVPANLDEFPALEIALRELGFQAERDMHGWRWSARVHGYRVKLEFLCDIDDQPAGHVIRPPGVSELGALNLRGTRYVAEDFTLEEVEGRLLIGEQVARVLVRVAGLQGYLLAKAHALLDRGEEKDYYDFVYVLLNNRQGGPAAAGRALREGRFAPVVRAKARLWDEIAARFATTAMVGPRAYAAQATIADPGANDAQMRLDAVAAVTEFSQAIRSVTERS